MMISKIIRSYQSPDGRDPPSLLSTSIYIAPTVKRRASSLAKHILTSLILTSIRSRTAVAQISIYIEQNQAAVTVRISIILILNYKACIVSHGFQIL